MAPTDPLADPPADLADREIITTRLFDAPIDMVWRAWTDPVHLQAWWGPKDFRNTFHSFDFRPGGAWSLVMHGPDGTDYPNECVFVEIARPDRIVLDHVSAPRFRITATFEDLGTQTRMVFRQTFETAEVCAQVRPYAAPGSAQMLERLAERLATLDAPERELTLTRRFQAPRALVWRAWTDPVQLARWWGPHGFSAPVCEVDARPGGAIHIVMQGPDGARYAMRGAFREVAAPERLVFSNIAADAEDQPVIDGLTTVTFTERDGGTEMVLHTRATAKTEAAVRMVAGMEAGWTQSIERLGALVTGGLG